MYNVYNIFDLNLIFNFVPNCTRTRTISQNFLLKFYCLIAYDQQK